MEEKENTPQKTPYYFQLCLLRGFEEDPNKAARKINTFVYNQRKSSDGANAETLAPYTGIEFEKYEIEKSSYYTWCNYEFLHSIAKGYRPSDKEIKQFLFLCALRSLFQNKGKWKRNAPDIINTNWLSIAYRAYGYNNPQKDVKLTGLCETLTHQNKGMRRMLSEFASNCGIGIYSAMGVRGFYAYQNMELLDVVLFVDNEKKRSKAERVKVAKIKESYANSFKNGTLGSIVNKIIGADVYTDEMGRYLCENGKSGMPDEYRNLANDFLSREKIINQKGKTKARDKSAGAPTISKETILFMTGV